MGCRICEDRGTYLRPRSGAPLDYELVECDFCNAKDRLTYVARLGSQILGHDDDQTDLLRRMTDEHGASTVLSYYFQITREALPVE